MGDSCLKVHLNIISVEAEVFIRRERGSVTEFKGGGWKFPYMRNSAVHSSTARDGPVCITLASCHPGSIVKLSNSRSWDAWRSESVSFEVRSSDSCTNMMSTSYILEWAFTEITSKEGWGWLRFPTVLERVYGEFCLLRKRKWRVVLCADATDLDMHTS